MKTLMIGLLATFSMSAFAHEIEGTLILKGSIKTKVMVYGKKTECKLKIKKVKNSLTEDAFGNPAYKVEANISLDGEAVKLNRDVIFTNLVRNEVQDLSYVSDQGHSMKINREGRVVSLNIIYNSTTVTCAF